MADKSSSTGAQRFFAAGVGAGTAEMLTLPVDAAKVRLQLQATTGSGAAGAQALGPAHQVLRRRTALERRAA